MSPLDYSLDDCKRLRELLDRRRISVAAVAGYTNFTGGMEAAEVPSTEVQIAYIEELARRAAVLGCDLVRVFSSYVRQDVPFIAQWNRTVESLRECCDRAARFGVTIGLQNHHDIGVDTRTLKELLLQVDRPNLAPAYDCWSLHLRGEDIAAGVKMMAERMRLTTVADYVTLPLASYRPNLVNYAQTDPPACVAVPMGKGEIDYSTFFRSLRSCGYRGWVSYEMCSPLRHGGAIETLDSYARTFIEYMQAYSVRQSSQRI